VGCSNARFSRYREVGPFWRKVMPPPSGQKIQPKWKNVTNRSTVCPVCSSELIDRRAKRVLAHYRIFLKDREEISCSEFVPNL